MPAKPCRGHRGPNEDGGLGGPHGAVFSSSVERSDSAGTSAAGGAMPACPPSRVADTACAVARRFEIDRCKTHFLPTLFIFTFPA
jgi:hypothetical protein